MTDEELVAKAQRSDRKAIGLLYERYVEAIHRFVWYQLHDEQVTLDLTQDVFIDMIHSLRTFTGGGSFKNWLYIIAKRTVLHHLKEKYQLPQMSLPDWIPEGENSDWIDPDKRLQERHKEQVIEKLLSSLNPEEEKIMRLVYLQNYTSKEAATVTGRTPISIRVIVHRCLKKLQKAYESK